MAAGRQAAEAPADAPAVGKPVSGSAGAAGPTAAKPADVAALEAAAGAQSTRAPTPSASAAVGKAAAPAAAGGPAEGSAGPVSAAGAPRQPAGTPVRAGAALRCRTQYSATHCRACLAKQPTAAACLRLHPAGGLRAQQGPLAQYHFADRLAWAAEEAGRLLDAGQLETAAPAATQRLPADADSRALEAAAEAQSAPAEVDACCTACLTDTLHRCCPCKAFTETFADCTPSVCPALLLPGRHGRGACCSAPRL